MLDVLLDSVIDSLKLLPFLFLTYLLMEYIEHKTTDKTKDAIKKSGKLGPLIGSILGVFPQCGFSVAATNFYAARVISLGTLISVYLSTSDEMLPILISEAVPLSVILPILGVKIFIGMLAGFIIDFILRLKNKEIYENNRIVDLCEHDHCECENGILKSSLKHTVNIFAFIFIITLMINTLIFIIGEETLSNFIASNELLGAVIAGIIGLIPNCASSVIITELYLESLIPFGTAIAGLLVSAGVGLLVLFKVNRNIKQNIIIVILLYLIGVVSGTLFNLLSFSYVSLI